ncbi:MAG: NAD-dependent epimerase/dehydratase family protein [Candidatus Hodarchaeota archaeon]
MILLTGGAGYIGSVVIRDLIKNHDIRVVDLLFYGDDSLKKFRNSIDIINSDIRKIEKDILEDVDVIIHLAAVADRRTAKINPELTEQINIYGTKRIIKICKEQGIRKFIFSSTCSVYECESKSKVLNFDENITVSPKSIYARSKYQAENEILEAKDKNFQPVILRQGTVYGFSPRMRYDIFFNRMVKDAFKDGIISIEGENIWRPIIEIRDLSRIIQRIVNLYPTNLSNPIINVATNNIKIKQLANTVKTTFQRKLNSKIKLMLKTNLSKKYWSYAVSTRKLENLLKFNQKYYIEDGIQYLLNNILEGNCSDFENPNYYNYKD